jgi:transposase
LFAAVLNQPPVAYRRRFYDIAKGGDAPIASEALERIAALYAIEKTIRGMSADDRRRLRQEKSKSQVTSLKSWFEHQLTHKGDDRQ